LRLRGPGPGAATRTFPPLPPLPGDRGSEDPYLHRLWRQRDGGGPPGPYPPLSYLPGIGR